jgi:hypothetical protein
MTNQEQSFDLPFVEQMSMTPLSLQSSHEPSIESPIVDDGEDLNDEGNDDDDDDDEAQNGEFCFSGEVISDSDDDECSDYSSDSEAPTPCSISPYGVYYLDPFTNRFRTFYRFVKPDPHTSCNAAAAALKEPVSLLTKYRCLRLEQQSKYFQPIFTGPPKLLRRGSPLKKV